MHRMIWLALVVACSTKPSHDITYIDASIDTPPPPIDAPPGPNIVDVNLFGATTPDLIAYRDGTGGWLVPETLATGRYRLHVTTAYELVAVCSFAGMAGSYDAEELAATVDDGKQFLFCGGGGGGAEATVAVTGTMNQAGTVAMSDTASSTSAPWNFMLQVPTGPHDLIAIGNHRMLLDRDIAITAATALPVVDIVNDGLAMGSATLSIAGTAPGESIATTLDIFTANDLATISSTTNNTVALPPPSLLVANDFEYLSIDSHDAAETIDRSLYVFGFTGSPTAFTLPPAVSGITYATSTGTLNVTWGQLPTNTGLDLVVLPESTAFAEQHVSATKSWVDATGATSLAFDSSAPNYQAAWKPDLAGPYTRVFGIDDQEATAEYHSQRSENVNGSIARPLPVRASQNRARRDTSR